MSTPPPGTWDAGWPLLIAVALVIVTYRLYDMGRWVRARRPKPTPRRRRFLSWDDQENIRYHQRKRTTE